MLLWGIISECTKDGGTLVASPSIIVVVLRTISEKTIMAKRYNTILNDVDYSLTIESNGRCKLFFRKMGSNDCFELDFNSLREYLIMTEELRSFFQKMIAEEEYELGLREFYFVD